MNVCTFATSVKIIIVEFICDDNLAKLKRITSKTFVYHRAHFLQQSQSQWKISLAFCGENQSNFNFLSGQQKNVIQAAVCAEVDGLTITDPAVCLVAGAACDCWSSLNGNHTRITRSVQLARISVFTCLIHRGMTCQAWSWHVTLTSCPASLPLTSKPLRVEGKSCLTWWGLLWKVETQWLRGCIRSIRALWLKNRFKSLDSHNTCYQ